jgi:hypothetical protein
MVDVDRRTELCGVGSGTNRRHRAHRCRCAKACAKRPARKHRSGGSDTDQGGEQGSGHACGQRRRPTPVPPPLAETVRSGQLVTGQGVTANWPGFDRRGQTRAGGRQIHGSVERAAQCSPSPGSDPRHDSWRRQTRPGPCHRSHACSSATLLRSRRAPPATARSWGRQRSRGRRQRSGCGSRWAAVADPPSTHPPYTRSGMSWPRPARAG